METDDGVCALKSQRTKLVFDNLHHMGIIAGVEFDKDVVATCGNVALDDLGYLAEASHHTVKIGRLLEIDTNKSACVIANLAGAEYKLRALKDANLEETLDALVNGRTTDVAQTCDLEEGLTGICGNEIEDFLVELVDGRMTHR